MASTPPTASNAYGESYTERFAATHEKTLVDQGLACVGQSAVRATGHSEGDGKSCDEEGPSGEAGPQGSSAAIGAAP